MQITYYTGGIINLTAEILPELSDRDIEILVYGTKWEYASFFTYSGLICAFSNISAPAFCDKELVLTRAG